MRVEVKPAILQWAIERAGDRATTLYERFPNLRLWQRDEANPRSSSSRVLPKQLMGRLGISSCPTRPMKHYPDQTCVPLAVEACSGQALTCST